MTSEKFKLARVSGQPVSDEELLADLRRVAEMLGASTVSMPKYRELGKFDDSNLAKRFGTWNSALSKAGLTISNQVNIADDRLFENILTLWQHYGRQPRRSELAQPPSTISQSPYNRRFGSWSAALEAFVEYANDSDEAPPTNLDSPVLRRRTGRDPSLRLRWHVLQRDRFTCCACGASPALISGVELHVDHVVPWSKGGETVFENLQTLCSACNLGKSNVHSG
ncbi:homing endonuclease associated repeat-containing protein [Methylomonas rosea]|uniref:HNH endonuclease n=1 Tax=Methylomonas rosea TaxID=2952227 RepID=A0ABT1TS17_9GAMM|nr:HNH endonuclease [Methylomonas sp. WSC-7]MCQ8117166.1 HNH endonuclease [Methylomonas sp. WSC-7]